MDMSRLEKIDIIRERTGLGYREAVALLDAAGWDVVEALARHEEQQEAAKGTWTKIGEDAFRRIKELVREGNVRTVRIKNGDRTMLEIPVTAGVVGAILAPELALIGAVFCLFTGSTVEIERTDGSVDLHPLRPE